MVPLYLLMCSLQCYGDIFQPVLSVCVCVCVARCEASHTHSHQVGICLHNTGNAHINKYNGTIPVIFLPFNRTQSRAVIDLLTGHNTLKRHLHLLGLLDSPLCRKCGVKEETSAHILCECEALASLRHVYLGSFFLVPEDIKSISVGAMGLQ